MTETVTPKKLLVSIFCNYQKGCEIAVVCCSEASVDLYLKLEDDYKDYSIVFGNRKVYFCIISYLLCQKNF